ncbi:PhoX family phosphatase [Inquilinus sp.]|uniref:PhoX family protein n=1 Tax=Inquilinus sp. TaxID=1932117 RepID=UPI0031D1FDA3
MDQDSTLSRVQRYEQQDDRSSNLSDNPTMGDIVNARFGRRGMLRGALAVSAISAVVGPAAFLSHTRPAQAAAGASRYVFEELEAGVDTRHHVAKGYDADILIRWGDPVVKGAPAFDPQKQTADAQEKQFGYNNDYIGYVPLPLGSNSSDHGLLVVNHEYTDAAIMFPGLADAKGEFDLSKQSKEQIDIEMAAHGQSVIEIKRGADGKWAVVADSPYNRRITARSTEFLVTGPAAGHDRLKTKADPTGTKVIGTINNCAGGTTPWGTTVHAEENFNGYFGGELKDDHPEARNYKRYGLGEAEYGWSLHHDRFDVVKEPNEANRFGWVVEIDPTDPNSTPKKRTALGRFKHEGAESIVAKDGRVVVYMGDDQRFDYLYKFVTAGKFNPNDRKANMDLLDDGTLYVAKFDADGKVAWMPVVFGQGPLTEANGFKSQADVLIETRRAADLLGATKMDRPEDVQPNPVNGKVYVILTNNDKRKAEQVDAANPRAENKFGHIVEITPADGDHAATAAAWDLLVKCGDPSVAAVGATFHPSTSKNGWFGSPDNCEIDADGRLWVATDGNNYKYSGRADGIWGLETEGEARGTGKLFFRVPVGAEMCGPKITPDLTTFFVAVQHPGEGGKEWPEFGRPSTFADPSTRWPDFQDGMPPRPSVVVITKQGGGKIGV